MKYFFILLTFVFLSSNAFSQESDSSGSGFILKEGKLLYRLEKASWNATDFILAQMPHLRDSLGGYLSYINGDTTVTLFYAHSNPQKILTRMYFSSVPEINPLRVDSVNQIPTPWESMLISIRVESVNIAYYSNDTLFSYYKGTNYNFIPVINEDGIRVFILTGPTENGYVFIGNDYLLTFNDDLKLVSKEKLHESIAIIPVENEDKTIKVTAHKHSGYPLITSTDICTLLLFKNYVAWNQHLVFGDGYVSMFDMVNEQLVILTQEVFDNISKQQNK